MVVVTFNQTRHVCIDQYEAYVTYEKEGQTMRWPFNFVLNYSKITGKFKAAVAPGMLPQAYMSSNMAKDACQNAGKRLCKVEEWMAGCQGPNNYTYPYGNDYIQGNCNEGRNLNPVIEVYGPGAKFTYDQMNDPRLDLLQNTVAEGGKFSKCVSDYKIYDMHGNMHEWIDQINEPKETGTFKGGFFVDAKINGKGCYYRTIAHAPIYHDYSIGFRCCADPVQVQDE